MLSDISKNLIKEYYKKIKSIKKKFLQELNQKEKDREKIIKYLNKNDFKNLDEFKFHEIISSLWATSFWSNKDYKIKLLIETNGFSKLKEELYNLLYGEDTIDIRYDKFKKEIKYLGPASITEILCLFDPNNFIIWNDKARRGLEKLKIEYLPIKKYYITGKEYVEIINVFKEILNELDKLNYPALNMLGVDYLLYEISILKENEEEKIFMEKEEEEDFDHNEIRDKIQIIGDWLGFETSTEEQIAKGAKVDVIWRAKIANLGVVTYVFEVHKKGSIDSLILNLQKALSNPTVQKLIAATNQKQIEEIKNEIKNLPENFRKSLTFWNVKDVLETYENLSKVIENINKLSLIKSQFGEEEIKS